MKNENDNAVEESKLEENGKKEACKKRTFRQKINVVLELLKKLFWSVGPFAVLIIIWELVRVYSSIDPRLMPSIGSIFNQLIVISKLGLLPEYTWRTVQMLTISFVVSTIIGYIIGVAIGLSKKIGDIALPVLRYFNSLPGIAWTPLFLMWFGFNRKTVLAVVLYTFIFPIIFNTLTGIRLVPNVYRQAILTMGGSRWRILKDVLVQGSLPSLMIGIRTGFGYSWRAIIGAEILAATGGLGFMIFQARSSGQLDRIVAGMIVIGVIWLLMDRFILRPLEKTTIQKWAMVQR